jgi:hypothetical protein
LSIKKRYSKAGGETLGEETTIVVAPMSSSQSLAEEPQGERREKKTVTPEKTFRRRNPTLKKKALELAELCNIPVCVISYGPDGTLQTWPESREDVEAIVDKYRNNEGAFNFSLGSLKSKTFTKNERVEEEEGGDRRKKQKTKKVEEFEKALASWDGWLDEQQEEEELVSFWSFLESKSREINERIEFLKMKEKRI